MSINRLASACDFHEVKEDELIHVDCIEHTYPDGTSSLHNVCFSLFKGEIVAICGSNGAGKSTLIEHLNGLLKPSVGRLVVLQHEVTQKTGIISEVGVVFQDADSQVFAPTVIDDVMFGPLNKGLSKDEARKAALDALESIQAAHLMKRIPYFLSKGEKRLVAIAGVLAMDPKVIVADEPTSDLDPVHSRRIESVLVDLKTNYGMSVVIATHDMDLAARLADRIYVLAEGQVISEGKPSDIFYDKAILKRAGLEQPAAVRIYESISQDHSLVDAKPVKEHDLIEILSRVLQGARL
ncbi:MAG: ATP-binding cassette domain-containing protein [Halobacteriota archaeon]|jgi:cobalt/nickel transport system ATP-binding protein